MLFKILSTSLVLTTLFVSCNEKTNQKETRLLVILPKDKVEKFLNKKFYLEDVSKQKLVDSVLISGDTIRFDRDSDPSFVPYLTAIKYWDSIYPYPRFLRLLGIRSPYNKKTIFSAFYLDKGITILRPYVTNLIESQTSFSGSKQNEPYFRRIELQYPGPDENRQAVIEKNVSLIKTYPYSLYLLSQLFYFKEKFSDEDLKRQLSFFEAKVKATPNFQSFTDYFAISSTYDQSFPVTQLENQYGQYEKIGSDGASYNLIVYWASWCGPCRKEIPELKELHQRFIKKGLEITSISIDADRDKWNTALQQEKMPWKQLVINDSTKAIIDLHYNIKSIPKIYLFDSNENLVKKFEDGSNVVQVVDELFAKMR
jgi:thiol-disulfide isomerase/thioredoxin